MIEQSSRKRPSAKAWSIQEDSVIQLLSDLSIRDWSSVGFRQSPVAASSRHGPPPPSARGQALRGGGGTQRELFHSLESRHPLPSWVAAADFDKALHRTAMQVGGHHREYSRREPPPVVNVPIPMIFFSEKQYRGCLPLAGTWQFRQRGTAV